MSAKKATKTGASEATYDVRDIVLAKVKGYPPWPAVVVDPETVPKSVRKERPISKKTVFYCVRFFPAGDYSWAVTKDMSRLLTHEIEAYINEPSKKNADLKKGYEIALNPGPWEEELARKQEEYDNAKAIAEEGVDQLVESEGGEDEVGESDDDSSSVKKKKAAGKKRRRDSMVTAEDQKKKRKSAQEALSAKRRPSKKGTKSKGSSGAESEDGNDTMGNGEDGAGASGKKTGKNAKGTASEGRRESKRNKKDKDGDDEGDEALASDAEAQRVKEWRHKLQRAFLTGNPPEEADMPQLDQIFSTVEAHNLTIEYLHYSKIGKVMRRIASLGSIPRDEEFKFKDRAQALVQKWQAVIQTAEQEAQSKVNGTTTNGTEKVAETATVEKPVEEPVEEPAKETVEVPVEVPANKDDTKMVDAPADTKEDNKEEAMDMSDS